MIFVKSLASINEKLVRLQKSGLSKISALKSMNDAIRTTIVVKSISDMKKAINLFQMLSDIHGIGYQMEMINNKERGYFGIHADLLISSFNQEDHDRKIKGEIQFHFEPMYKKCCKNSLTPSEKSHQLYSMIRLGAPKDLTKNVAGASLLIFMYVLENIIQ